MRTLSLLTFALSLSIPVFAQPFSSGSTGADGVYSPTQSGDFDPVALGIDADGDNVFHFTTVNIPNGVTIRMKAWKMRRPGPVYFLTSGNVTISGTLDLSGEFGGTPATESSDRRLSQPGPGGYPGGAGGKIGVTAVERGFGPGSAAFPCLPAFTDYVAPNYFAENYGSGAVCSQPPSSYGNALLLPLVGGSGGAGGPGNATTTGGRGGAGGGAIRLSSNTLINITGTLTANGGGADAINCIFPSVPNLRPTPGTGGAVHLQAPAVSVSGVLAAFGGGVNNCGTKVSASTGRIRLDSSNLTTTGSTINPPPLTGPLLALPVPTNLPAIRFVSIGGVNVPLNPTGSLSVPDMVVNSAGTPTTIQIGASGIPLGTNLTLIVESAGSTQDQSITTSPLAGSLASSTGSASVTLPLGLHRLYLRVIW